MTEFLIIVLAAIVLAGALATALVRDPFSKLIALGVMIGGVIPFIVARGYLDVAIAVSLIAPIATIFVLLIAGRREFYDA